MTDCVFSKNTFLTMGESRRLQFKRSFSDSNLEAVEDEPVYIIKELESISYEKSLSRCLSDTSLSEPTECSDNLETTYHVIGHSVTIQSEVKDCITPMSCMTATPTSFCMSATPTSTWSTILSDEESSQESSQESLADQTPKKSRRSRRQRARALESKSDSEGGRKIHAPLPHQPRIEDLAAKNLIKGDSRTTVMVRHIPCNYSQPELLKELDYDGFVVNFLYLPPARYCEGNLGFAFVNFVRVSGAAKFIKKWTGHQWYFQSTSPKRAAPCYAELQGFEANVAYYRKHKVMKTKSRPIILY